LGDFFTQKKVTNMLDFIFAHHYTKGMVRVNNSNKGEKTMANNLPANINPNYITADGKNFQTDAIKADLETVTQFDLARYLKVKQELKDLKGEYFDLQAQLVEQLEGGHHIEEGTRKAELKPWERVTVSWRSVAERLAEKHYGSGKGKGYCNRIVKTSKPTQYSKLVVS
jgi:hypothetical protein